MLIVKNVYFSELNPGILNGIWMKPVGDKYQAVLVENGQEKNIVFKETESPSSPSKAEDDNAVAILRKELIGSVKDKGSKMTLNGLKNYIDEKIASLKSE